MVRTDACGPELHLESRYSGAVASQRAVRAFGGRAGPPTRTDAPEIVLTEERVSPEPDPLSTPFLKIYKMELK